MYEFRESAGCAERPQQRKVTRPRFGNRKYEFITSRDARYERSPPLRESPEKFMSQNGVLVIAVVSVQAIYLTTTDAARAPRSLKGIAHDPKDRLHRTSNRRSSAAAYRRSSRR